MVLEGLKILGSWDEITNLAKRKRHQISEYPDQRGSFLEGGVIINAIYFEEKGIWRVFGSNSGRGNHDRFSSFMKGLKNP